jgi:hypothetical protein
MGSSRADGPPPRATRGVGLVGEPATGGGHAGSGVSGPRRPLDCPSAFGVVGAPPQRPLPLSLSPLPPSPAPLLAPSPLPSAPLSLAAPSRASTTRQSPADIADSSSAIKRCLAEPTTPASNGPAPGAGVGAAGPGAAPGAPHAGATCQVRTQRARERPGILSDIVIIDRGGRP